MSSAAAGRSGISASARTTATAAPSCAAVAALPRHGVRVLASSSTYETEPVGEMLDQPDFLNACLRIETALDPEELLDACKAVERELGREAGGPRHGPRPIDVDVLLLGDLEYASERLRLPHAEVTSRRFVLVPLLELDPRLATARTARPLADALAALDPAVRVSRAGDAARLDRQRAGGQMPAVGGEQPLREREAGRPSSSGSTSSIVASRRTLGAICRSAAFGSAPPMTPSAIQASTLVELRGQRREVLARLRVAASVAPARDARDPRRDQPPHEAAATGFSTPRSSWPARRAAAHTPVQTSRRGTGWSTSSPHRSASIDARAGGRVLGQQPRLRHELVEPVHDRARADDPLAAAEHERRHGQPAEAQPLLGHVQRRRPSRRSR